MARGILLPLFLFCMGMILTSGVMASPQSDESQSETVQSDELQSETVQSDAKDNVEPKPARSQFDLGTFHEFVSHTLSRPTSRGSLEPFGFVTKTVTGRVVDHNGRPIVGAKVAFVEAVGFSDKCYDENFDLTDEQGRFLVIGGTDRSRIVVQNIAGHVFEKEVSIPDTTTQLDWPQLASCKIIIGESLQKDLTHISVMLADEQGLHSTRQVVDLDNSYTGEISNLMPGSYRVYTTRGAKQGESVEVSQIEIAKFTVAVNENLEITCNRVGQRRIIGKLAIPLDEPVVVRVIRQKSKYSQTSGNVDIVSVNADGIFETDPLPPGRYQLRFLWPQPDNPVPRRAGGFRGFGPMRRAFSRRIVIPETNEPFEFLHAPGQEQSVADFIQGVFDSEGNPNHSFSYSDIQVSQVAGHEDKDAVVAELIRLLKDEFTPYQWEHLIQMLLASMTDSREVVAAIMEKLEASPEARQGLIWALTRSTENLELLTDGIEKYRHDENPRIRSCAYHSLLQFVQRDNTLKRKIEPWLLEGLSDPFQGIREAIIPVLGRIKAETTLSKLIEACTDDNYKIRVFAAYSVYQLTGEAEPAIKVMTQRLNSSNLAGQNEAAYLLANFESLPEITKKSLRAKTRFSEKENRSNAVISEKHMIKNSAINTLNKIDPDYLK